MTVATSGETLHKAAIKSSYWTVGGFGAAQVVRFCSNVVLSHLLYKEAFALVMIVNAIVQGLQMFSDIGLGPSIIQHPRGDERRFLGTAFSVQVIRGTVLAGILLALTLPTTAFYASKDSEALALKNLLPVAALSLFVGSFYSTKAYSASRHMALWRITLLDLTSQLVAFGTTVGFALWQRDPMALVLGSLAASVTKVLLSHLVLPGPRDTFAWDPAALHAIIRFGGWIFISTITTFLAMQLDRLVFPSVFDFGDSGVYNMAATLAAMVPMVAGSVQLSVVFPLYSRILGVGSEVGPYVEWIKRAVFTLAGLLIAWVIGGGAALIQLVYDDRWQAAGWMIAVLSVGAWFQIIESLYGAVLLARGKAYWVAFANVAKPTVLVLWFLVGGSEAGLNGAVFVWAAADVAKGIVSMWGAHRQHLLTLRLDLIMTARALITAAVLWLMSRYMHDSLHLPPLVVLAAVGIGGLLAFGRSLRTSFNTLLREDPQPTPQPTPPAE